MVSQVSWETDSKQGLGCRQSKEEQFGGKYLRGEGKASGLGGERC